jgi:hypothetical protein
MHDEIVDFAIAFVLDTVASRCFDKVVATPSRLTIGTITRQNRSSS